ncbi:cucumisin [Fagus crenata]
MQGLSINTFELENTMFPIVYGGDAPNTKGDKILGQEFVKGKIVLCDEVLSDEAVLATGAVGTIMADTESSDVAFSFTLPNSCLSLNDDRKVKDYYNSSRMPSATIQKSIEEKDELAPYVVSFSSRGLTQLQPVLTAPGADILAALSEASTVTGIEGDTRVVPYNIISGMSMSCPHATAAAAYIKSFHPTWSPAAVNLSMKFETNPDAEFAYGAGHINPARAISPGLVYDAGEVDYLNFLCGQGYSSASLRLVTGDNSSCSRATSIPAWYLNYPSFTLSSRSKSVITRLFPRTVTNVGSPVSTYKAIVNAPTGLKIEVIPNVHSFESLGQKKFFSVKVTAEMDGSIISGSFVWYDGVHRVRSPVVAYVSS